MKPDDLTYLNMRMHIILRIWGCLQNVLNSPWSNIRHQSAELIMSMIKINVNNYISNYKSKLKNELLPLLMNLLKSKESESKASGLNILASFCGFSEIFSKDTENLTVCWNFRVNSNFISVAIWQLVFDLQEDWDNTIRDASVILTQLAGPREAMKTFHKLKSEWQNLQINTFAQKFINKINSKGGLEISDESNLSEKQDIPINAEKCNSTSFSSESEDLSDENVIFCMDKYSNDQLLEVLSIFTRDGKIDRRLWNEYECHDPNTDNWAVLCEESKSLEQIALENSESQSKQNNDIIEESTLN